MAKIKGTDGDETLRGSDKSDIIFGFGGNDTINAGDGDDFVYAGSGDDSVSGNRGNDAILGGSGLDTLSGGGGNDAIDGGADSDTIDGGLGNDVISGGIDDDAGDTLTGGPGSDSFVFLGTFGNDTITDFDTEKDQLFFGPNVTTTSTNDFNTGWVVITAMDGDDVLGTVTLKNVTDYDLLA